VDMGPSMRGASVEGKTTDRDVGGIIQEEGFAWNGEGSSIQIGFDLGGRLLRVKASIQLKAFGRLGLARPKEYGKLEVASEMGA